MLPFKRFGIKYFVVRSIPWPDWSVAYKKEYMNIPVRVSNHTTRKLARAECKRLNGPIGSKYATMCVSGGFNDAAFKEYAASSVRGTILAHIEWNGYESYDKVLARRIAIYHLYIVNRK